jgi:hypothetical protein
MNLLSTLPIDSGDVIAGLLRVSDSSAGANRSYHSSFLRLTVAAPAQS